MKHIVMILGTGLTERRWARDFSKYAKVTLVQMGLLDHIETWEDLKQTFCGGEVKTPRLRTLDDALCGTISFLRMTWLLLKISRKGKIDLLITSFYSVGMSAHLMRLLGKIRRSAFFMTDYLPPIGPWYIRLHRRVTYQEVRLATKLSDEVWLQSPRLKAAKTNKNNFLVPMRIGQRPDLKRNREEIAYLGYPSEDHALDVLFEICRKHSLRLNIIGNSPYLQSIKHLAPPGTQFHGVQNDEGIIGDVLSRCFCGFAIYRNTGPTSYSYYGFPTKTLYYFASNVPTVITNVAYFNETFEKEGIGHVVEPIPEEIEKAVLDIRDNYEKFSRAIDHFRVEQNAQVEIFNRERLETLLN